MMFKVGVQAVGGGRSLWGSAGLLLGVLLIVGQGWAAGVPAGQPAQVQGEAAVAGDVVDATGQPVSGAVVTLEAKEGAKPVRTLTDARGHFVVDVAPVGAYTVRAEKAGVRGRAVNAVIPGDAGTQLRVVLGDAAGAAGKSAAGAAMSGGGIEFSDKPDFTIAGVTDWTAVGGHGSDATLRTSEDLARQTLRLRAQGAGDPTSHSGVGGETESQLRRRVADAPHSYAANHALGMYYLENARFEEAIAPLKAASDVDHAKAEDEYELARACQGIGDLARAREHVERALAEGDAAAYHRLAGALDEALGDSLDAVKQDERATEMEPSEQNYFAWGSELLLHRAIWQAAEVFAKGAAAYPASARLRLAWGAALFAGARYDDAAQRLCEASDLAPAEGEPYRFMGRIVVAAPAPLPCVQGRLKRFREAQPRSADAAYFYAMSLAKEGGARDRVVTLLKQALALDPKYAPASLQLGILAFAERSYPAAIEYYQRAIEADPQDGEAHYRLGVAYDRTGEAERARAEFRVHDALERAQADAVEQQRRHIKQFMVVLQGQPTPVAQP